MQVIKTEKIPIKVWADAVEESAMQQVRNLANLPFAFRHIAIMPDVHCGYGMPIGGVLATRNMIIPNAVGVDIGCGMCAVKTSLTSIDRATVEHCLSDIRRIVPLGFNHHTISHKQYMPELKIVSGGVVEREYRSATYQIGSLGGGNHFIELQNGSDGYVWIMLHSGSRNLGKQVAEYYNKKAKQLQPKMKYVLPRQYDLAYFPLDSKEGDEYSQEMRFCLAFAQANRDLMMQFIKEVTYNHTRCSFDEAINIHHNYAMIENHFNTTVIVHRKGATSARSGEMGIIPGSQGTPSFIVVGKGNPDSFTSCSHGAGRVMGRKQASRTLNLRKEQERLDAQGIVHRLRSVHDLDEAPGAYKDIVQVMASQRDLVDVVVSLSPLGVIKA